MPKSIGCLDVGGIEFEVIEHDEVIYLLDHNDFQEIPTPEDTPWDSIPIFTARDGAQEFINCDPEVEEALKEFLGL